MKLCSDNIPSIFFFLFIFWKPPGWSFTVKKRALLRYDESMLSRLLPGRTTDVKMLRTYINCLQLYKMNCSTEVLIFFSFKKYAVLCNLNYLASLPWSRDLNFEEEKKVAVFSLSRWVPVLNRDPTEKQQCNYLIWCWWLCFASSVPVPVIQ